MYGNGYSMAIVLDHGSSATSLTGNLAPIINVHNMQLLYAITGMEITDCLPVRTAKIVVDR